MERRTLSQRQAMWLDIAIVVLAVASGVWRELAFPAGHRRLFDLPIGVYAAMQIVGGATLVARRRWPNAVGAANAVLNLVSPTQASYIAAYGLGAHSPRRRNAVVIFVVLFASWILGAQLWRLEDPIGGPVLLCLSGLLGLYVKTRRDLYAALVQRAERAERDQDQLARQAVAEERVRIASDMHDAVTHQVTLMVLHAGALSVSSPIEHVRQSAEDIRVRGVDALVELRDVIGLLRANGPTSVTAASTPVMSSDSLARLVAGAESGGVDVRLREHGRAARVSCVDTPTIHRIVQEGLTNAIKHAPGSTVTVDVDYNAADTVVTVGNSPSTTDADVQLHGSGTGTGLAHLQQRLTDLGGSLHAEPRADGGFELTAHVPPQRTPPGPQVAGTQSRHDHDVPT